MVVTFNENEERNKDINQKDEIILSVPGKPEYVGVIRLTLAAIASRMGFDIEKIEDMKVAVAEACTNAIIHGCQPIDCREFNIKFSVFGGKLIISVSDSGKGCNIDSIPEPDLKDPKEGGLGIFIIKSLMDKVEISCDNGKGMNIKMIKYLGEDV